MNLGSNKLQVSSGQLWSKGEQNFLTPHPCVEVTFIIHIPLEMHCVFENTGKYIY